MRLQKHVSRKVDDKEYAKFVVIIPPNSVTELGWKEGQELQEEVKSLKEMLDEDEASKKGKKDKK
jgi:hypothetical protein